MDIVVKNMKKAFKEAPRLVRYFDVKGTEMTRGARKLTDHYEIRFDITYDGEQTWDYNLRLLNPQVTDMILGENEIAPIAHFKDVYIMKDYQDTLIENFPRFYRGCSEFFKIFCKEMFEKNGLLVSPTEFSSWKVSIGPWEGKEFRVTCLFAFTVKQS